MQRQSSSAFTRFPDSSRYRGPEREYEDELQPSEPEKDYYDHLILDSRRRRSPLEVHDEQDDFEYTREPRCARQRNVSNNHAAIPSRSLSYWCNASSTMHDNRPSSLSSRLYSGLKAVVISGWAAPMLILVLALWMWKIPDIAFFWPPAAGISSLSSNLIGSAKSMSGHLASGLKHQTYNLPGMPTVLHYPRPEKPKKEKLVYPDKWSQVYWTVNDQYHDMISSTISWDYENGRQFMDHMSQLWILVDQQKRNWQLYDASMERQCRARLVQYDRLPAQMWFEFLHKSNWEEFMYNLQYSYSSATEKLTHIADSFTDMRKRVDGLLKAVRETLATERIRVYKEPSLTEEIRSYFDFPEQNEAVDIENHDWVVDLEEIQLLLKGLHEEHNEMLDQMVNMKLHIDSDEVMKQEAAASKRPAFVGMIMEAMRKDVKKGGLLTLPVLRNASQTGSQGYLSDA